MPSVLALDDDRLLVAWLRYKLPRPRPITCELCGGRTGRWAPSSTLGSATMTANGSRSGAWHPWARIGACWWSGSRTSEWCAAGHASSGLSVTLDDATKLVWPVRVLRRTCTVWTMGCMW